MRFKITRVTVTAIQPTRASTNQRPCRRVSDPLRTPGRSMSTVGLCCRFIDAPGSCLHANCLCMQALLFCLAYYHMCVLKSLRESLRTGAPHRQLLNSSLKGRRLRANHLLGHLTYLNGKPDRERSMLGKRLNAKVWNVKCRKSCVQEVLKRDSG